MVAQPCKTASESETSAVTEIKPRSFISAQMVAERAGVSRSAVSRTFTNGASVSEATRVKVLKAAEELGYHVNRLARGLIQDQSNIICLVVADIPAPFQSRMLDVLTRRLQVIDRVAMVINTTGDEESVAEALRQTLHYRADATVVLSGTPAASLIETCIASGQHVILINRDDHPTGTWQLAVDNATPAREAFFLLQRAGCGRLCVISSNARTPSLLKREAIFVQTAAEAGMNVEVMRAGPTSYGTGVEAARQLFARAGGPDGVFCVTDLLALGFMDAARHEFGLRVPDDLSIVGFDDIEQAGWQSYDLTTFRQPMEEIGDFVAGLLTSPEIGAGGQHRFQAQPVWRKTVRPRLESVRASTNP
jgi:DNA-binding LacI/PurR family transcriptional regulator